MRRKHTDDWGTPIGTDPDPTPTTPTERKMNSQSLVYYFKDHLPLESMDRIGSPVNGPALMKGFKKLREKGFTHDEIRVMIDSFIAKIKAKPLPPAVLPWRAFLSDLDSLAQSHRNLNPQQDYGKWGIDPRLMEDE